LCGSNSSRGWAVDPVEADAFGFVVVQDLDGVAVKDGDDGADEIRGVDRSDEQEEPEDRKQ
jgi:hypothetical protein